MPTRSSDPRRRLNCCGDTEVIPRRLRSLGDQTTAVADRRRCRKQRLGNVQHLARPPCSRRNVRISRQSTTTDIRQQQWLSRMYNGLNKIQCHIRTPPTTSEQAFTAAHMACPLPPQTNLPGDPQASRLYRDQITTTRPVTHGRLFKIVLYKLRQMAGWVTMMISIEKPRSRKERHRQSANKSHRLCKS